MDTLEQNTTTYWEKVALTNRSKLLEASKVTFFLTLLKVYICCCYLFTIGILKQQHRSLIKEIERLISLRLFNKYVPLVEITSLVPSQVSVQMLEQSYQRGNIRLDELFVIIELLQARQPAACFEIGTFDGRTALNMAVNTPEQTLIYTLDLPRSQMNMTAFPLDSSDLAVVDKETSGIRYQRTVWEHKIQQLYGDSATFDYTPYQGKIDFVFIDGSHTYEYVLSDSRNAITLLRDGKGIILWHDYDLHGWPLVVEAVNYLQRTDPRFANVRYIENTTLACLICD